VPATLSKPALNIQAEQTLKAELMSARPDLWLGLAEERRAAKRGQTHITALDRRPVGIGTTTFLQTGLPHWAVSIALEQIKAKIGVLLAFVFRPARMRCSFAEKGAGAWMNEGRLAPSRARSRMIDIDFCHRLPFRRSAQNFAEYLA